MSVSILRDDFNGTMRLAVAARATPPILGDACLTATAGQLTNSAAHLELAIVVKAAAQVREPTDVTAPAGMPSGLLTQLAEDAAPLLASDYPE